jgi:hypothetical protein
MHIHRLVLPGVVAALALTGCGESKEDKAQSQVCDARASIQSEIDAIRALPPTTASVSKLADSAKAIETDLKQIADAQDDLAPERKQQVQAAGKTFRSQVQQVAGEAVASGLTGNAGTAVRSAGDQLAASFKQALAPIDCS